MPDDASSLTEADGLDDSSDDAKIDLGKKPEAGDAEDRRRRGRRGRGDEPKDGKADGETDAK